MDSSLNTPGSPTSQFAIGPSGTPVIGNVSPKPQSIPPSVRDQLLNLLGPDGFSSDTETKDKFSKTSLPRSTTPLGVCWPRTRAEVSALMEIVTKHSIPWHAISRGKNWGYGAACAPHDGYLIVDLRKMNRIIEINEELAYAVIEPGVSQGQLADELNNRQSRLMLDVTGAGPNASIVGNVLQRGFGHTPYGDRTANSCNYEAVLPTGAVIHTGFGDVETSNVGHVYPYGNGPNCQGMLAQNNAAIVTRMTIWLMPRPERIDGFGFKTDDPDKFAEIVNRIGRLRQSGTINSVVHLANDLRVVSSQPWMSEYADHREAFTAAERAQLRKRAGIASWNGLGGIYGSNGIVAAKKRDIRKALKGVCQVRFFSKRIVQAMNGATKRLPNLASVEQLRNLTASVTDVYDLLNGRPSPNHLEGAFYRNRPESGKVVDAGLIWIAPVIPFTGVDVQRLVSSIEPIANRHGFDLPITISPVVPRAAVCIANISYNKLDFNESKRASACYSEIRREIEELGYPPYRGASVNW
jgi:4-cresol dehydrogenase (hydroxylating)